MSRLDDGDSLYITELFRDLCWDGELPQVEAFPDPLSFYRDFVSTSRPCVIKVISLPLLRGILGKLIRMISSVPSVSRTLVHLGARFALGPTLDSPRSINGQLWLLLRTVGPTLSQRGFSAYLRKDR